MDIDAHSIIGATFFGVREGMQGGWGRYFLFSFYSTPFSTTRAAHEWP